jgi:hypothetical protein
VSRAFVKEAEDPDPRCPAPPGCDGVGVPVTRVTLVARLGESRAAAFHEPAFYCPDAACPVAYFDAFRGHASRDELLAKAYPKHEGAPLCACFGVARETIEDYGRRGDKAAMRTFLERVGSSDARCALLAVDGKSCATEARRTFMRALEGTAEERS